MYIAYELIPFRMTDRKQFIRLSSMGLGSLMIPDILMARSPSPLNFLVKETDTSKKIFANMALKCAREKGATYADVRVASTPQHGQEIMGVRVLVKGKWGYASITNIAEPDIASGVENAVMYATEKKRYQYNLKRPHQLWQCAFFG
jgi:TldD protein